MRSPSPNRSTRCCQGPLRRCKHTSTNQVLCSRRTWSSKCHTRQGFQIQTTSRLFQLRISSEGSRFDPHRCSRIYLLATDSCTCSIVSLLPKQSSRVHPNLAIHRYCTHTRSARQRKRSFHSLHPYKRTRISLGLLQSRAWS